MPPLCKHHPEYHSRLDYDTGEGTKNGFYYFSSHLTLKIKIKGNKFHFPKSTLKIKFQFVFEVEAIICALIVSVAGYTRKPGGADKARHSFNKLLEKLNCPLHESAGSRSCINRKDGYLHTPRLKSYLRLVEHSPQLTLSTKTPPSTWMYHRSSAFGVNSPRILEPSW